MPKDKTKSKTFIPHNTQCRLCHFAGFSNRCDLVYSGQCTVIEALKSIRASNT
ncbi:MAG: hypothetical protein HYU83_00465 [Chloroflexi bacterium]|nr:hypothetical protein [Chloroflexota bacterium]MBI4188267.1 hypothetical protein [Chloroflexota bacterium]